MISTNDVKPGMALNLPDGLYQVVEYQHVKPGKGKAFVRMKLKNLTSGGVVDRTFRAGENLPRATIDRRDYQYLFRDDLGFTFMDGETFDQLMLTTEAVGAEASYLAEGATFRLSMFEGKPIGIELPAAVELEVTHTEHAVKGDRVSSATKPVTLSTGLVIQTPLFVDIGDIVKVDTRTGDYITRVS